MLPTSKSQPPAKQITTTLVFQMDPGLISQVKNNQRLVQPTNTAILDY